MLPSLCSSVGTLCSLCLRFFTQRSQRRKSYTEITALPVCAPPHPHNLRLFLYRRGNKHIAEGAHCGVFSTFYGDFFSISGDYSCFYGVFTIFSGDFYRPTIEKVPFSPVFVFTTVRVVCASVSSALLPGGTSMPSPCALLPA